MRILLLAQFFPPDIGGEEQHVFNLAEILANRGHVITVATQRVQGCPDEEMLSSGVHVYRFGTVAMNFPRLYSTSRSHHPPVPDPLAVHEIAKIIREAQPDVVHAHNWAVNSVMPLHRRLATPTSFGLVLTLHDYSNVCATKRLMRAGSPCDGPGVARCFRCCAAHYGPVIGSFTVIGTAAMRAWKAHSIDHVVSVSRAVASGNHIRSDHSSSIIPNFIPDSILLPQLSSTEGPSRLVEVDLPQGQFLLFVGDLSTEKGVPILLRAYERLGRNRPPLVLIGRRVPDTPQHLPVGVELRLEWPHDHVLEAFRQCTFAILPSLWPDPCPTTVLEAMASGSPVVTTSMGGIVDMIVNEESGLVVPPGDASALATAMDRLLADESLRSRLVSGAQERVQEFTASRVVERLEAVYAAVAPKGRRLVNDFSKSGLMAITSFGGGWSYVS